MRVLVTGSSGHLGEALVRVLGRDGVESSASTSSRRRGRRSSDRSPTARSCAGRSQGVDAVVHAATLHKPHVASHRRQDFVDTNVTGTLNLLEEAVAAGRRAVRLHELDDDVRPRAHAAAPARPPPGSPRTSCRCRRTSTAPPRSRPRTCASSSTATTACRASCCARRASSPSPTTATRSAPPTTTSTSRSTSCCTGASTSRTSSARTASRSTARREIGFARLIISATTPFTREDLGALGVRRPGRRAAAVPGVRGDLRRAGVADVPRRSTGSTSTSARAACSAGRRATTSPSPSSGSRRARTRAAPLALEVGAKGYHAESFGPYTTR